MKRVVLGCLFASLVIVLAPVAWASEFQPVTDNTIPDNAFIAGYDADIRPLHICRVHMELSAGKKVLVGQDADIFGVAFGTAAAHFGDEGRCQVVVNGSMQSFKEFDILTYESHIVSPRPIRNDDEAQKVCPTVCKPYRGWVEPEWMTTVPGRISTCACKGYEKDGVGLGFAVIYGQFAIRH